jgi:hypothetical protein
MVRKKILLSLGAVLIVAFGVIAVSAYEAHVVNVTAHIENALKVLAINNELVFGTVFPQEHLEQQFSIQTSESFCKPDQRRVLNIDYKIVQKPKCVNEQGQYAPVNYWDEKCPEGYKPMPSLCEYLSKKPKRVDPAPYTDYGVLAFHNPEDPSSIAIGTINKDHDLNDDWIIDLAVPCFSGMCAQDWPEFVYSHNPDADPRQYELPAELESQTFGCDLWVEVTRIY